MNGIYKAHAKVKIMLPNLGITEADIVLEDSGRVKIEFADVEVAENILSSLENGLFHSLHLAYEQRAAKLPDYVQYLPIEGVDVPFDGQVMAWYNKRTKRINFYVVNSAEGRLAGRGEVPDSFYRFHERNLDDLIPFFTDRDTALELFKDYRKGRRI